MIIKEMGNEHQEVAEVNVHPVVNFEQIRAAHTDALSVWAAANQEIINLSQTIQDHGGEVDMNFGAHLLKGCGNPDLDEEFHEKAVALRALSRNVSETLSRLNAARLERRAQEAAHN